MATLQYLGSAGFAKQSGHPNQIAHIMPGSRIVDVWHGTGRHGAHGYDFRHPWLVHVISGQLVVADTRRDIVVNQGQCARFTYGEWWCGLSPGGLCVVVEARAKDARGIPVRIQSVDKIPNTSPANTMLVRALWQSFADLKQDVGYELMELGMVPTPLRYLQKSNALALVVEGHGEYRCGVAEDVTTKLESDEIAFGDVLSIPAGMAHDFRPGDNGLKIITIRDLPSSGGYCLLG